VWLVQDRPEYQIYSNGLRIENTYLTSNARRMYQILDRKHATTPHPEWFSEPVGIVFHTTENPLPEGLSTALLQLLRERCSYNFVIDRFGRTHRVVDELDAANHAGNSIWANGDSVYVNLNNSFLAVAFDAQTPDGGVPALTPAQLYAGRLLTQVLRSRFRIPAENCVTHAQVSVNPMNMRMGYHTDGANQFPFIALGLPDNYRLAPAAITEFGFEFDSLFEHAMGDTAWEGITDAQRQIATRASAAGTSAEDYQSAIQQKYKKLYAALKLTGAMDEPR
jgi:hypothetical protein